MQEERRKWKKGRRTCKLKVAQEKHLSLETLYFQIENFIIKKK